MPSHRPETILPPATPIPELRPRERFIRMRCASCGSFHDRPGATRPVREYRPRTDTLPPAGVLAESK